MNLTSATYKGWVRHRRFSPVGHSFRTRLFMTYVDLQELATPALRSKFRGFRRSDHFGDPAISLDVTVRDFVESQTTLRPMGPIRVLTHLRCLGYVMNPVSFFYCFAPDGLQLETIVAEVHNTPWNETHCYIIPFLPETMKHGFHFRKQFHVSPFMPMEQEYCWRFTCPEKALVVHMENVVDGQCVFDATLVLKRFPLSRIERLRTFVEHPLMTHKVIAAIYWQALRLWRKGCPYHAHPKKEAGS
ncbi:MAG: DUF1365 domain-containing protein [Armatimonadetes bacterium]|nr:DUF1365 domain-containing protein [Armatimonadota bacterium]